MAPVNRELIEKYLKGEYTPEEEQEILRWLDYNDLGEYEEVISRKRAAKQTLKKWRNLTKQIPELEFKGSFPFWTMKRKLWTAAAVLIGLIVFGGIGFWLLNTPVTSYKTGFGEVKSISLPDGTIVTLNATSSILVGRYFNKKDRTVFLKGEAFFQVKQHAGKPFIVKAGKLHVTALGTSFDVSAFEQDKKITVVLKEGKVAVGTKKLKQEPVLLNPGEEVVFNEAEPKKLEVRQQKDKKEHQVWQQQILYFNDAGLQEVKHKLERFYGVKIDMKELEKQGWKLSGSYKNEPLENVLKSLSFSYGLKYEIEGDQVTLEK